MSDTHHLIRRKGVWYYHGRVPERLAALLGRSVTRQSLKTAEKKEAVRLRALLDVRWDAIFAEAEASITSPPVQAPARRSLDDRRLFPVIQTYVETALERWSRAYVSKGPANEAEKQAVKTEVEIEMQILQRCDDPRADEWVLNRAGAAAMLLSGVFVCRRASAVRIPTMSPV